MDKIPKWGMAIHSMLTLQLAISQVGVIAGRYPVKTGGKPSIAEN